MANKSSSADFQTDANTEYGGLTELLTIERGLCGYNADLTSKLATYIDAKESVLEFGAGIGTLAIEWERQTGAKPECVEIDDKQRQIILGRGFVCYDSIRNVNRKFSGIYASNVFEHIEDDIGVMRQLKCIMTEGAVLAIYVPALMVLYSEVDRSLGHYRRYQKKELIAKARQAGFTVTECHYADCLGCCAWFITRFLANREGTNLESLPSLRFYDKWIYPVSRTLDRLFMRRVVGKNLMLIAHK